MRIFHGVATRKTLRQRPRAASILHQLEEADGLRVARPINLQLDKRVLRSLTRQQLVSSCGVGYLVGLVAFAKCAVGALVLRP